MEGRNAAMVATTRTVFDKQLDTLRDNTLQIAELVTTQIQQATKAFQKHDMTLARRVAEYDAEINRLRYNVEEQSYALLALQQPNARDMRRIVATVSVVTNLERMGDHAAGIARLALRLVDRPHPVFVPEFDDMAEIATANLNDAMLALTREDADLARQVVGRDDQVDHLHELIYKHLIQTMTDNPSTVECATMMLWVSHNLERYSDRISNICERIVYFVTGNLHEPRIDPMP
jgi:phosphate transport system protein